MARVLLGMSGGIDSSVAAILLKNEGHEIVGATLRLWSEMDDLANEKLPEYLNDAKQMANNLGIDHIVEDVRESFYQKVIQYFIDGYLAGRTPNPCAKCNVVLKWEVLNQLAEKYNCDYIASGHYVKKEMHGNFQYISKGVDPDKEQSFFLWGLSQQILKKALFPLGKLTKQEVKLIARQHNLLKIEKKKESTGICFLNSDYQPFMQRLLEKEGKAVPKGNFVDESGKKLGMHSGYPYYTVGQRRGLGLVPKEPYYVKQIIPDANEIVLGNRNSLYTNAMQVHHYNLIRQEDFKESVITKIRYRKQAALSRIEIIDANKLLVHFLEPEWSIAPGQTAAFYKGDRLLGGGFIYQ